MPDNLTTTVNDVLIQANQLLTQTGIDSPRLDAELLLAEVLKCRRVDLMVHPEWPVREDQRRTFNSLIERRLNYEPVAYILGRKEFMGLTFTVNSSVLVPRPETELLVERVMDFVQDNPGNYTLLDLCTGSGCIAVSCAQMCPSLKVTASDISPAALDVARENITRILTPPQTVELIQSDLFAELQRRHFDFILSNPPYIADADMEHLSQDVKNHEPHLALNGGPKGIVILEKIVHEAPDHLNPGGWLFLEIGSDQGEVLRDLLHASGQYELKSINILRDLAKNIRFAIARKDPIIKDL